MQTNSTTSYGQSERGHLPHEMRDQAILDMPGSTTAYGRLGNRWSVRLGGPIRKASIAVGSRKDDCPWLCAASFMLPLSN
jgi:hypothetical protein